MNFENGWQAYLDSFLRVFADSVSEFKDFSVFNPFLGLSGISTSTGFRGFWSCGVNPYTLSWGLGFALLFNQYTVQEGMSVGVLVGWGRLCLDPKDPVLRSSTARTLYILTSSCSSSNLAAEQRRRPQPTSTMTNLAASNGFRR